MEQTVNQKDQAARAKLRQQAEARMLDQPSDLRALSPEQIQTLVHELQVHQIELEMQNEELRTAQEELESSRAKYFDLYDLAPVGYFTLNDLGLIVQANLTGASMLGIDRRTLMNKRFTTFVAQENSDEWYTFFRNHNPHSAVPSYQIWLTKSDGTRFYAQIDQRIRTGEDGKPEHRIIVGDITERDRLLARLASERERAETIALEQRRQAEELSAIFKASAEMILVFDKNGFVIRATPNAFDQLGENPVGKKWHDFAPRIGMRFPDGRLPQADELPAMRALRGETVHNQHLVIARSEEKQIDFLVSASPLWMDGAVSGAVAITRNITERVLMENRLRRSHEELEQRVQERTQELQIVADKNRQLYESEQRERQVSEIVRATGVALTETLNLEKVLNTLLDHLVRLVPCTSATVLLFDSPDCIVVRAARGHERWEQSPIGMRFDTRTNAIFNSILATQKSCWIEDAHASPDWERRVSYAYIRNWLGVPLIANNQVIGVFSVDHDQPGFLTMEHVHLVELLAGQASLAIQNAWLYDQVSESRERLRLLSQRLVQIQENERTYIARELHDEASQALTSLMVHLRLMEKQARRSKIITAQIAQVHHIANDVMGNLRRLAMNLRPAALDHIGLAPALQQYIETIDQEPHTTAHFDSSQFQNVRLPLAMETMLYRIAQEGIANAIRHAQATEIHVCLEQAAHQIRLTIRDNGKGFVPEQAQSSGRLGLVGLRERVEMLEGTLKIQSSPGAGTTLIVESPYDNSNSNRR